MEATARRPWAMLASRRPRHGLRRLIRSGWYCGRSEAIIWVDAHLDWPWSGSMPEGLSPIEAGKQRAEHNKEPHEPPPPTGSDRHGRIVQIGEALLLSLVTIAAAWSGYAAAKGGTESSMELPRSAA